jgi:hypothetical protein
LLISQIAQDILLNTLSFDAQYLPPLCLNRLVRPDFNFRAAPQPVPLSPAKRKFITRHRSTLPLPVKAQGHQQCHQCLSMTPRLIPELYRSMTLGSLIVTEAVADDDDDAGTGGNNSYSFRNFRNFPVKDKISVFP